MNFVAHQFLSFHNTEIQLGNLYGEVVRGNNYRNYSGDLQRGILLHRKIDSFTDANKIVKRSTHKFHEKYGKYAPVIVDVFYDYLLIKNWRNYSQQSYADFVSDCYTLFERNFESFPPKLQYKVGHLLQYDWFGNYQTLDGIKETLKGISQRSKFPNQIDNSIDEFLLFQEELDRDFSEFFPLLIQDCRNFLNF